MHVFFHKGLYNVSRLFRGIELKFEINLNVFDIKNRFWVTQGALLRVLNMLKLCITEIQFFAPMISIFDEINQAK